MSINVTLLPPSRLGPARRWEGRAAVALATVLARRSPQRIHSILTRLASGQRPATRAETQQAWTTATSISRRCAGRRGCVTRSLAIVLLCRRRGAWPTWCVGVRAVGLPEAHAWVEAERVPVGEPDGTASAYRKILTVEARQRT